MDAVDNYIANSKWSQELELLRELILDSGYEENFKWSRPIYQIEGKNVVGISGFKQHIALWFFNGVFLKDNQHVLENAQDGKTKAMRQWRFTNISEIQQNQQLISAYLQEAKQNQLNGNSLPKSKRTQPRDVKIPKLLEDEFARNNQLKVAFQSLSPSCQREYSEYINEAKKEETKERRLLKIIPMIESKKGLNDQYK